MSWRIYYADGSTYSSEDGPPESAPGLEVQAIAQTDEATGHSVISNRDFYWWDSEYQEWAGGDLLSLAQWLASTGVAKVGSYVARSRYGDIIDAARHDSLMPERSAWRRDEYQE